jgi:hypothetical protein
MRGWRLVKASILMCVLAAVCAALAWAAPPSLRVAAASAATVAGVWAIATGIRERRRPGRSGPDEPHGFDPPSFEDAITMLAPPPRPRR